MIEAEEPRRIAVTWKFKTCALEQTGAPVDLSGVRYAQYEIHLVGREIQRAFSTSEVLYVGEGKPSRRNDLLKGKHSALARMRRLMEAAFPQQDVELAIVIMPCGTKNRAVLAEAHRLSEIVHKHGELPPCNANWERWWTERVLWLLASTQADRTKTGLDKTRAYDWPAASPVATCIDISTTSGGRERWLFSLIWIWPKSWTARLSNEQGEHAAPFSTLYFVRSAKPSERSVSALEDVDNSLDLTDKAEAFCAPGNWGNGLIGARLPARFLAMLGDRESITELRALVDIVDDEIEIGQRDAIPKIFERLAARTGV